jgi:hypothetical protein
VKVKVYVAYWSLLAMEFSIGTVAPGQTVPTKQVSQKERKYSGGSPGEEKKREKKAKSSLTK